ncbi:ABC transporter permease [Romboutsia sedimentorum]|uniref:ABC transporter permease n=1 Tax=Romboutsia sedimentorum TaxID=1368474 RepID=A0ABT7ECV7_9FIRM|nr:ABC transporter permease [Romboutsia sedimentorum]MDK2563781.1 ABC transporter permease [Romboutsia sedimentorum]MDK2586146.1 ABC transporter permease [Romboutsia sedimentorum]
MLGKLLKYELKSTSRTFIPMYVAILLVSVINRVFINTEMFKINGIALMVLGALFVALGVLTIVVTIQRFRKNLLEDEGYLMFTLPVSIKKIILSKYLVTIMWTFLSGIVAILSFAIIMSIDSAQGFKEYLDVFKVAWESLFTNDIWIIVISSAINFISVYSIFIFSVYISLSMGQLPKFNKHRNIVALITFFVLNTIISNVLYSAKDLIFKIVSSYKVEYSIGHMITSININTAIYLLVIIILFSLINYILNRKLNLE